MGYPHGWGQRHWVGLYPNRRIMLVGGMGVAEGAQIFIPDNGRTTYRKAAIPKRERLARLKRPSLVVHPDAQCDIAKCA